MSTATENLIASVNSMIADLERISERMNSAPILQNNPALHFAYMSGKITPSLEELYKLRATIENRDANGLIATFIHTNEMRRCMKKTITKYKKTGVLSAPRKQQL